MQIESTLPAISHELEFIAFHLEEVQDVVNDKVKVDPHARELSDRILDIADKDAAILLRLLHKDLKHGVRGTTRFGKVHPVRDDWDLWNDVYLKGRRKRLGYVGLHIGYGREEFRLIAYMKIRPGGLDVQRKFVDSCRRIGGLSRVHLSDPRRYPGWTNEIVWFEKALKAGMPYDKISKPLCAQATLFFKLAKPYFG